MSSLFRFFCGLVCTGLISLSNYSNLMAEEPKKTAEVEGISEYQYPNGLRLLVFPDGSKPTVTVNLTIFVGSRHEGYGEAGMAHLLEHMLFKGTPTHGEIPKLLQERGARFNGTTWVDRTNYYETMPASDENLEFALRLEADRMVNSFVRAEDLASEMTVVRSEFEQGENSPFRVLLNRMQSTAYEWHNYGKTTIGNRSDIERVPITNLRDFYKRHYQPDNAMLIVAGKIDPQKTIDLVTKYFGSMPKPDRVKDKTYTEEPAQDGERTVVLRRVGDVPLVGAVYHIPASSHPDFPALRILNGVLTSQPSGKLYKAMVESQQASVVFGDAFAFHDPGMLLFGAMVTKDGDIEQARQTFIDTIEGIGNTEISEEDVERIRDEILSERDREVSNVQGLAIALSDWAAQGDWRLFFIYRDRIENVTVDDVKRVAKSYLARNNRTVGLFIPTTEAQRIEVPQTPSLKELVENYKGRESIAAGEEFDPSPENIEARTIRKSTASGLKLAMLPKKTRGEMVHIDVTLRYGNEESLAGLAEAAELLPELMVRGTSDMTFQQLQEALNKNRASLSGSGQRGLATFSIETKRENLKNVLGILKKVLREPKLDPAEFDVVKRETLSGVENQQSDPQTLAQVELRRTLSPYPQSDIRYTPTVAESIEKYRAVSLDQVHKIYGEQLSGSNGEVAIVGDFSPEEVATELDSILSDWRSRVPYKRVAEDANLGIAGSTKEILTPDKSNAVYFAGLNLDITDSHEDYPAMVLGNFILGGGTLSSRLGNRVRQKEGLSYGIRSVFSAHPIDRRSSLMVYAINNPANRDKVVAAVREELELLLKDGITEKELQEAKQGFLQAQQVSRANDSALTSILGNTLFVGRDMAYFANFEKQISELTVDKVNSALRKHIDLKKLTVVTAGDFKAGK